MSALIGQKFDRYQILELLGEGGMATVYKAYDTRLEREVAIKIIRREAFPPDQLDMILKRFEREAKALGRFSHPNIVGVIDYGEYAGAPYLVMVYFSGGTLKEKLGKPIPWRDAVKMILPIAHALEYVHDHHIINRDVKPSNILLTEKGQPMLTDFGLVKLFEGKDATSLTASGSGIGTPDYMAPEQWGGETSPQSDQYSLGVVLYEMVTGHRPYVADTPVGVLLKQVSEALPFPKDYVPDLPQNVESVLLKTLARKPEDRYPDMLVFANELQNLLDDKEVIAATVKTETLRERMTGKIKKQEIEQTRLQIAKIKKEQTEAATANQTSDPQVAGKKRNVPLLVGIGALALLVVCGGCWLTSSRFNLFNAATSTKQTLPSIELTRPPQTSATLASTDTPQPTEIALPVETYDSKNITMRLVPGGEFTLGNNDDIDARPEKLVNVDTFYIDKYEVTNEMYAACANDGACRIPRMRGSNTRGRYYGNPEFTNYPALFVDWKMANAYCAWRGARLPTEAEWEKAARGTDKRIYPWGNQPGCKNANYSRCVGDTNSVNQYDAGQSAYGVYGMAGNALEWTSSLFRQYPYVATDGREDQNTAGYRVARGGAWDIFSGNGSIYTYTRFKLDVGYYGGYVGFRCAATPK